MTIPPWRSAIAAGALIVLGAVGGGLVQAAATPSAPTAAAVAASDADTALLLDAPALTNDTTSSGTPISAQLLGLHDRIQDRIANVRGHLVHGMLTVVDRDGKLATYELDHGTVSAVGSRSITIAEAGGSSVTVSTSSDTRVRKGARPSTLDELKAGDDVLVRSSVAGGTASATLVIVLPANTTTTAPSSGGNG
jgi:hypothetical protein